ncbi:hypothetical protein KCP70_17400 [Salmonella enterica subsp. enterica]|nr:hypothetical protein KCP70_17400 [Salmonella enterica subsp. enterica]
MAQRPVRGGGLDKPEHDRFAFISPVSAGRICGKAPKARCQIMFAAASAHLVRESRLTGWRAGALFQRVPFAVKVSPCALDNGGERVKSPVWARLRGLRCWATGRLSASRTGYAVNSG